MGLLLSSAIGTVLIDPIVPNLVYKPLFLLLISLPLYNLVLASFL
jgi:hypothetical protein